MAHEGKLSGCRDEPDHDVENGNDADYGNGNKKNSNFIIELFKLNNDDLFQMTWFTCGG